MRARIRVVLVRPRRGGNVGQVARAMKNMGLSELCLVAPRTPVGKVGARMAAHAGDVLAARRTVATLQEAVGDCVLTIGTVGRATARREAPLDPPAFAAEALAATAHGTVALVFGPEDHGLSNAEIDLCQKFVTLPTDPGYASLNLAQAVLLCASEILRADPPAAPINEARRAQRRESDGQPASGEAREALFEHLQEALVKIGFVDQQHPAHIMRGVRSLFARADTTVRDVAIWRGIARQILWSARGDSRRD
ncbi:MAG: RNA methyltransferase [Deltaproteobacteria bacterium]